MRRQLTVSFDVAVRPSAVRDRDPCRV